MRLTGGWNYLHYLFRLFRLFRLNPFFFSILLVILECFTVQEVKTEDAVKKTDKSLLLIYNHLAKFVVYKSWTRSALLKGTSECFLVSSETKKQLSGCGLSINSHLW